MKRTITTLIAVAFLGGGAMAQEEVNNSNNSNPGLKFQDGDKNVEALFTPFSNVPVGIRGIKFRYFNSSSSALRLTLNMGGSVSTTPQQDADDELNLLELTDSESRRYFNISPGYEIHLEGTDKLSPYYGAELNFGLSRNKSVDEQQLSDANGDPLLVTYTTKTPYTTLGLNLLGGADFYFSKSIYIGGELGFGFGITTPGETKIEVDPLPPGVVKEPDPTKVGSTSRASWGPNVEGALRIGILF